VAEALAGFQAFAAKRPIGHQDSYPVPLCTEAATITYNVLPSNNHLP